jgi:hypothetical protein
VSTPQYLPPSSACCNWGWHFLQSLPCRLTQGQSAAAGLTHMTSGCLSITCFGKLSTPNVPPPCILQYGKGVTICQSCVSTSQQTRADIVGTTRLQYPHAHSAPHETSSKSTATPFAGVCTLSLKPVPRFHSLLALPHAAAGAAE